MPGAVARQRRFHPTLPRRIPPMRFCLRLTLFACLALALLLPAPAGEKDKEKDVTNYVAQKDAPKDVKKIVFIADAGTHGGRGNHEFVAGALYLARTINAQYPKAYCVVHSHNKMPKDLEHADAIIVLLNHGGSAADNAAV